MNWADRHRLKSYVFTADTQLQLCSLYVLIFATSYLPFIYYLNPVDGRIECYALHMEPDFSSQGL